MQFDTSGHLLPYQKLTFTPDEFRRVFVDGFPNNITRRTIYADYQRFVTDLQSLISPTFTHWIDGSFVTMKNDPADLDVVTFLDHGLIEQHEALIRERFKRTLARQYYPFIDAYIVDVYAENHPSHFFTLSDEAYWLNWFTKTKPTRWRQALPKGFVSIQY